MKIFIWSSLFALIQIAIFSGLWFYYGSHSTFKCPCLKYQQSFPVAKASAMLININLFFTIMSYIKLWRRFIYISSFILNSLHNYFIISFISWTFIHVIAHYVNFIKVSDIVDIFTSGTGLTGNIMIICIITLISFSWLTNLKQTRYSLYITVHHLTVFILLALSIVHGTFCTIKYDINTCPNSTTWMWLLVPLLIIFVETIYKYIFNKVYIKRVIHHKENIIELQLPLMKKFCGKTIWINCVKINTFEWHPFTITKWNAYNNTCSIHIKIRGDWTLKLQNQLQNDYRSLKLRVNGPYYCLQKDFLNQIINHPTLLVASGIGITNFVYSLKQISKNPGMIKTKITMIIIIKSSDEIYWLLNTFLSLKEYIHFIFYFTEISQISFPFQYHFGRPQFENIMDYLILQNIFIKDTKINVYYSGLPGVVKSIRQANKTNDVFYYNP